MPSHSRIVGEGEMAGLIRGFDWSKTVLGPIDSWSDTLVTSVNLVLASRHPMFLWWGPELIQFYNDGYRPSIRADKHPSAVGQRGIDCWPEIWPIIGPQIEAVMSEGKASWNTNQLVPIMRNGKLEEVYWTYGYSPVRDHHGTVQGTLVVCTETTEQVIGERRLQVLLSLSGEAPEAQKVSDQMHLLPLAKRLVRNLERDPEDIPFAILYLRDKEKSFEVGTRLTGEHVLQTGKWPLQEIFTSGKAKLLEDLNERFGEIANPAFCSEPVRRAYVVPLPIQGSEMNGVLIFGISPRLPFDDNYRTFFDLVSDRVASLLQAKFHQSEIAKAAERFRNLAEANPFGMLIATLDGGLKYVNKALLDISGYSQAEVASGKVRWDSLTPPEYQEADARAAAQLRQTGRCEVYEKAYIAKNGKRIPILVGAAALNSDDSELEIAAFVTDLSPLKRAEEALRLANDELEKKVAERTATLELEVRDRKRAESGLRDLTGLLLRAQDDERRHMARELHDHAGQILAALGMNLHALRLGLDGREQALVNLAAESQQLSDDLSKEIRTLSYLLHPPLLDEVGLESALQWYVSGFSERSGIQVELQLPEELSRLSRELELVLFRIVQESLTNVHRHSGSSSAKIRLTFSGKAVEVEITDKGQGIPAAKQPDVAVTGGVGIQGMRERVRQFGGSLEIHASSDGTAVLAVIPLEAQSPSAS